MLRRYSKLQDVCFQLDRFRKWNTSDELTLHAFMLQSKLQPSLKNFIRQRIAEKVISGNFFSSELAGHIESHYCWSTFVKVLVEQNRCALRRFVRNRELLTKLSIGLENKIAVRHAQTLEF
jgi:hypothetical protein